jgi:hypothetical protein
MERKVDRVKQSNSSAYEGHSEPPNYTQNILQHEPNECPTIVTFVAWCAAIALSTAAKTAVAVLFKALVSLLHSRR